ncbi:MAG: c-type cytochrome domain-containing protein [Verrucomicrobiota bacterium]
MKISSMFLFLGILLAGGSLQAADDKWDVSKLDASKLPPASAKKGITFAKDIRPIFEASCFRCHGEEKQKGELRLDSLEAVLKGGEDGKAVVSGDSKKSPLVFAVAQIHDEIAMPPKRKPGGPGGQRGPGGPTTNRPAGSPDGSKTPGGRPGPGGPGGPGGFGPPAKPLTSEQVGLVRAWIDQGAK